MKVAAAIQPIQDRSHPGWAMGATRRKLLIISDIHGNLDALDALSESYDELWVLGDLVNYGPQPKEVMEAVMARATLVVQGNHDHAVGHDDDSRCSARYRKMAEATRRYTSSQLSGAESLCAQPAYDGAGGARRLAIQPSESGARAAPAAVLARLSGFGGAMTAIRPFTGGRL